MPTIAEVVREDGRLTTLIALLNLVGLVATLDGPGPFTVFAPTDDAFAGLPAGTLDALLQDNVQLKPVLTRHIVAGAMMAANLASLTSVKTVEGDDLTINADPGAHGAIHIDDATVIQRDIKADNGVVHVIDTVLTGDG